MINNWITEKTQELQYKWCEEVAKWSDIKNLYTLEANNLIKLSKLTELSLIPKPIEQQKVSAFLQVFNDVTVAALNKFFIPSWH